MFLSVYFFSNIAPKNVFKSFWDIVVLYISLFSFINEKTDLALGPWVGHFYDKFTGKVLGMFIFINKLVKTIPFPIDNEHI